LGYLANFMIEKYRQLLSGFVHARFVHLCHGRGGR
jgi:hypothetical protein